MSLIKFLQKKNRKNRKLIKQTFIAMFVFIVFIVSTSLFFGGSVSDVYPLDARHSITSSEDLSVEIFFNDLDGIIPFGSQLQTSVAQATESIYIAMYSINDQPIIELLQEKYDSGIDVKVLVPKNKRHIEKNIFINTTFPVIEIGIDSRSDISGSDRVSFMHHKFILIDHELNTGKVLFGSTNITEYQQKFDSNFLVTSDDNNLKKIFYDEFKLLEKNIYSVAKLRTAKYKPFALDGKWSDSYMKVWFGPGFKENSFKTEILSAINKSKDSINILGWRINDRDIYNSLVRKSSEGVDVNIILDDYYMWSDQSVAANRLSGKENINIFTDSYNDILFKNNKIFQGESLPKTFNSFLHHHTMIIDDTVLLAGTNNWGNRGFYFNDEQSFVTDNEYLVGRYVDEFNYLSNKFGAANLDVNFDGSLVSFNQIFSSNSDLEGIIYVERSYPEWIGYVCQEFNFTEDVVLNSECITNTTRIFIHDKQYNLVASSYLPLKENE